MRRAVFTLKCMAALAAIVMSPQVSEAQLPSPLSVGDITQMRATLTAGFAAGSSSDGFQYKYGTLPELTTFSQIALSADSDPLEFTMNEKSWKEREAKGWVECFYGLAAGESSELTTTFTLTKQTDVTFDWMVSSEEGVGVLSFIADGTVRNTISGLVMGDFATVSCTLPAGEHTLTWQYAKSAATNQGLDLGMLRNIRVQNTTPGEWLTKPATSSAMSLSHLYPGQNYLARAFSVVGGDSLFSNIVQFETLPVSIGKPEITDTTQATATVSCDVSYGDAEVETGVMMMNVSTDRFARNLLSPQSDVVDITHDPYWKYGDGYVYMDGKQNEKEITATFTLKTTTRIEFRYKCEFGDIIFYVDDKKITELSSNYERSYSYSLPAGKHTLKWVSSPLIYAFKAQLSKLYVSNTKDDESMFTRMTAANDGNSIGHIIHDLKPDTEYRIRTYMKPAYQSELESLWSEIRSDLIKFCTLPVVAKALPVENLRQASVTLRGSAVCGDAQIAGKGLQYRVKGGDRWSSYSITGTDTLMTAAVNFLRPDTEYEYRTYILAEGCDTVFSDIAGFTTVAVNAMKPKVAARTQHTARLQGKIIFGDAMIYCRGMQFRPAATTDWQTIEDGGEDSLFITTHKELDICAGYEARTFVQPAGCDTIYSDVLSFKTKNVEAFADSVSNIMQGSATLHGRVSPGDDAVTGKRILVYDMRTNECLSETTVTTTDTVFSHKITGLDPQHEYGFIVEATSKDGGPAYSNVATEDEFIRALTAEDCGGITVTHDPEWKAGDSCVYMTGNENYKKIEVTFFLTKPTTVSFDWSAQGYYNNMLFGISLNIDGRYIKSIYGYGNNPKAERYTYDFPAGKHTIKWHSSSGGNGPDNRIQISNLFVSNTIDGACRFKTKSFVQTSGAIDVTQTKATLTATALESDVTPDEYGFEFGLGDIFERSVTATVGSDGVFDARVTDLMPNDVSCYRAYAKIGDKIDYGDMKFVETADVVLNLSYKDITQSKATMLVEFVDLGDAKIENIWCGKTDDGDYHPIKAEQTFTGLVPNTSYRPFIHYRIGDKYNGLNWENTKPFTTLPVTVSAIDPDAAQTSAALDFGLDYGDAPYVASGIEYGTTTAFGDTLVCDRAGEVRLTELDPNTTYYYRPYIDLYYSQWYGQDARVWHHYGDGGSFTTSDISVATLPVSCVSNRSARMNGTADCDTYSSAEIGFQWKQMEGWSSDPAFTRGVRSDDGSVSVGLANGMLEPNTDYQYRTAVKYKDRTYTSDWVTFRTESEFVLYPASVYTMFRTDRENNCIVFCGYYVLGSEEVIEQGYEYWPTGGSMGAGRRSETSGVVRVTTGSDMTYTLDNSSLADGMYSVRAFAQTAMATYYGETLTFGGGTAMGVDAVEESPVVCRPDSRAIVVENASGKDVKVYDMSGRMIRQISSADDVEIIPVNAGGVYVVRITGGLTFKVAVR